MFVFSGEEKEAIRFFVQAHMRNQTKMTSESCVSKKMSNRKGLVFEAYETSKWQKHD